MLGAYLVLAPVIGYLAFREAKNFQSANGRPPWDLSPMAWALIVAFSGLLIGGILLFAARRSTRPRPAAAWAPPTPAASYGQWSYASAPSTILPATAAPTMGQPATAPLPPPPPPPPSW